MPIFVIKDQNMPIRHTEKETADKVMAALKNPSRLFKSSVINWAGTTIDTDVPYVEVISRILLDNLEILESIPCIRRSLQYRTQGHDGIFDASSNRKEEIVGMILFNQKTVSPDYGEVLDYQIPLKANGILRLLQVFSRLFYISPSNNRYQSRYMLRSKGRSAPGRAA